MEDVEKPPRTALSSMVVLSFGGEDRVFNLKLRWIDALQQKSNSGLGTIAQRLISGNWYTSDITEVLFYGLVGGGMPAVEARAVINTWCDGMPLARNEPDSPWKTAQAVIGAVFFGIPEDETAGKLKAATPKAGSMSRPTTDKGSQSASPSNTQRVFLSENGLPVELNTGN